MRFFIAGTGLLCENDSMTNLIFLKLGGSLITDKTVPYTPRKDKIASLVAEIAQFWLSNVETQLILGHGSGSFGHTAAQTHGTRQGVKSPGQWKGFAEVWYQASVLNRFMMDALNYAGIPSIAFAPVAAVTAKDGKIASWDLNPIHNALAAGLVPVVYGDVVFDDIRGGTILSTEDLFAHLAVELHPQRILLAGLEEGVWESFPDRTKKVDYITLVTFAKIKQGMGTALGADVTGGMESKVEQMLELVKIMPDLTAQIFSGEESGRLLKAMKGENVGTTICVK
jgi:isopentenyl phosphate kinase